MTPAGATIVRPAGRSDAGTILGFVRELAAYERLSHEVVATEADIAASLFRDAPTAHCLIAERGEGASRRPVGFALYFRNYSTFLGRSGIYLEDLYVTPDARGCGAGRALLARLADLAVAERAGRLEWSVLDWNAPAIDFYRSLGALPMEGWTIYRLSGPALNRLARSSRGLKVSMIVAAGRDGCIGRQGALPWKLSSDLRRFKALTMGKPVIMGRKTFESIGRALPGRPNVVVTRQRDFSPPDVTVVHDAAEALRIAEELASAAGANEICVIGGGEIYAALVDDVDEVRLTIVDAVVDGDAFMPTLGFGDWRGDIFGEIAADDRNEARALLVDLRRRR